MLPGLFHLASESNISSALCPDTKGCVSEPGCSQASSRLCLACPSPPLFSLFGWHIHGWSLVSTQFYILRISCLLPHSLLVLFGFVKRGYARGPGQEA